MRPAFYKCPNHLTCTIGYHGDDVEVSEGMVQICPECGTALVPVRKPTSSRMPSLVNAVAIICIAVGIWLAWPGAVKLWKRFTTPPAVEGKK